MSRYSASFGDAALGPESGLCGLGPDSYFDQEDEPEGRDVSDACRKGRHHQCEDPYCLCGCLHPER
jgi:hypothetical protein